eukprot:g11547.t1
MPRRTSSRLRGGAAAGVCEEGGGAGAGGASDGDSGSGGGGGGGGVCPPFPPSPGKRKARSPVEDEHGFAAAGLVNPHPVRCASFQSPKKRAQGVGDRCGGPFDKENDTSSSGLSAPLFGDASFRLSAYSAFSQHSSAKPRVGARRRSREQAAATSAHRPPADAPSTPRVPTSGGSAAGKGPVLPFLLAPASVTKSPDLRRKASSRRAPRSSRGTISNSGSGSGSGSGLRRSRDSSNSPSEIPPVPTPAAGAAGAAANSNIGLSASHDPPPTSAPHRGAGRHAARSGAGCAAGGRRSSTPSTPTAAGAAAAMSSSSESASAASPIEGRTGGGPAGSYRRAVGGARLGAGGGGGGGTTSDHSPHRSPGLDNIHRLTESLQKWDPGSRYASPADDNFGEVVGGGGGGAAGRAGSGGGGVKDVGASWNGQELRGTLEKERVGRGRRRRHSVTSAEDMYPQGVTHARFGDHSPISPASSAASINLGAFDACTPASVGRPWRSSPRRAEGGAAVSGGSDRGADGGGGSRTGGADDEGVGSAEHFGIVRMEGSWSEDDTGPSGTVMRLAFSPGSTPVATPAGATGTGAAAAATRAGEAATIPPAGRWQHPFSPVKGQPAADLSGSRDSISTEADLPASPEQHQPLHSMRDLMDQGTDDEEEGRGGPVGAGAVGDEAALVRRRRRKPRPELALRTLEMPYAMDATPGEAGPAASVGGAEGRASPAAAAAAAAGCPGRGVPNPLVSPAFTGKSIGGGGAVGDDGGGFGSGCTTTCRRWEGPAPLEGSSACTHDTPVAAAGDAWIREHGKGKGRNWGGCSSSSGFGVGAGEDGQQDVSGGAFSEENTSAMTAGLTDTSSASESSTSFVKSRPIPDQSAFCTSRLSKGGTSGPLSPPGSHGGGGGSGGGPAVGPAPMCLTPRKSMMRCPPTPQRTPTWDGLEDSLLLEGAGSGGRGGGGGGGLSMSLGGSRSCLRQSKLLASSSSDDRGCGGGGDGGGDGQSLGPTGMSINVGLANAAAGCPAPRRSSPRFEAAAAVADKGASGGRGGGGGRDRGSFGAARGTGGRRGRGRGVRGRSGGGSGGGDGVSSLGGGRGNTAEHAASAARGDGDGDGGAGAAGPSAGTADSTLGFKHDFVQMGPIGEGGFSVVWKVRAKGTGRMYAIKRSKREFRGRRDRDRCLLEARALQRLGEHPGVLRFERAWQEEGHFCLQTELCELGTLKDFLERLPSRREIPERAVWQVLHDVGQALRHVHAMGLVHLDVKPANLLIGDEGGRLKLADFGMATAYGDGVEGIGDGQEGDTLYMAKELLSSTARLPSADMFSLGLTVYEMSTRMELPGDGEYWHAMRDGTAVGLPSSRSQELGAVLRQLMHPDPSQRPTADTLCEHPRVANVMGDSSSDGDGGGGGGNSTGRKPAAGIGEAVATPSSDRDDYVVTQARAWRAAEAAAMDHPSSGLRTPTGDMSALTELRQIFAFYMRRSRHLYAANPGRRERSVVVLAPLSARGRRAALRRGRFTAAVILSCFLRGAAAQYDRCTSGAIANIGNGRCDAALNVPSCGYDGGDCCPCTCVDSADHSCVDSVFNCVYPGCDADDETTSTEEATCIEELLGDGVCAVVQSGASCGYDGGDIGDGYCDPDTNVASCGYDGGDCCPCSCSGSACVFSSFDCVDPDAEDEFYECKAPPAAPRPCSADVQREWVVDDSAQAQALTTAVNCSGGSFEVEWRGAIVVDEPIYVADGTTLTVSGVAGSLASIDGNSSTRLFTVVNAALHLDGLNVTRGSSTAGGAIAAVGSTLTFNRTNFVGNSASGGGGAVFVSGASSVSCAHGTTFVENIAGTDGGAMLASGGSVVSCGGRWLSNSAVAFGGALRVEHESSVSWSEESVFELNTAGSVGGALSLVNSSRVSWDALTGFYYNAAGAYGGGLSLGVQCIVSWQADTVFLSNSAGESGGSAALYDGASVSWSGGVNTVFDGNQAVLRGGVFWVDVSSLVSWSGDGNTTLSRNGAGHEGGAFWVSDGSRVWWSGGVNTVFDGNQAGEFGGAFSVVIASGVSWSGDGNTVFDGNHAGQDGGTFSVVTDSGVSWSGDGNTMFDGNHAGRDGGAFSVILGSEVSWSGDAKSVFNGNQAGQEGGAFSVEANSSVSWGGDGSTVFDGNHAGHFGGAFDVVLSSNVSWSGEGTTLFDGNQAGGFGGALAVQVDSQASWAADTTTTYSGNSALDGGAIWVIASSSLYLDGATSFRGNVAYNDPQNTNATDNLPPVVFPGHGGAVYLSDSTATINGSVAFTGNEAVGGSGGAGYVLGSNVSWVGQTDFSSNVAGFSGGGLGVAGGSTLSFGGDVTFTENKATLAEAESVPLNRSFPGSGGAMAISINSSVVWRGGMTQFVGNSARGFGSALHIITGAHASWSGSMTTFVNNSANLWGTLSVGDSSEVTWSGETIFEGNAASSGGGIVLFDGSYVGWTGETTFSSNAATIDGGAVASVEPDPTYNPRNSTLHIGATTTFSNNTSGANGGGLSLLGACSLEADQGVEVSYVGNSAEVAGGAVFVSGAGAGPLFSTATFVSNSAQVGGAVSLFGSGNSKGVSDAEPPDPTTFDRCRFVSNRATTGGAIDSAAGHDSIFDSTFEDNVAGTGGALRLAGTTTIDGCSFVENFSDDGGGAAVSNIGTISVMAYISFSGNGFNCPAGMFLHYNASGDPYEVVCDGCQVVCDGCVFAEPLFAPICTEVISHTTSAEGKTTLEELSVEPGYWRATNSSETVLACHHADACLGGKTGTSDYCLEGYEGPYCAICSEGHTAHLGFVCSKCSSSAAGVVLAVVLAIVALIVAAAVVSYATTGEGDGRGQGLVERVARYIPLQSVKIVIVAWQILTQFTALAGVTYPHYYQTFLDGLNVFNFDLSWILSAGCIVDMDFHDRLLMSTIGPIVAVIFLGCTYTAAVRIHGGAIETLQNVRHKHVSLVLLLTFFVYSSVSSALFSTFACEELDDGKDYLRSDYRIECDSPRHRGFKVYAGFMIVVYTVGIPAFYACLLFKDRGILRQEERKDRGSASRVSSTSDLWKPYKPSVFYYEVIECARRILLAGVIVFIYPNSAAQIAVTLLVAFAFVLVSEGLSPYASRWDHWISRTGHVVVIASMYVALLLKVDVSGEQSSSQKVFEAVLVAVHAVMMLVVLVETVVMGLALKAEHREDPLPRLQTSGSSTSSTKDGEGKGRRGKPEPTQAKEPIQAKSAPNLIEESEDEALGEDDESQVAGMCINRGLPAAAAAASATTARSLQRIKSKLKNDNVEDVQKASEIELAWKTVIVAQLSLIKRLRRENRVLQERLHSAEGQLETVTARINQLEKAELSAPSAGTGSDSGAAAAIAAGGPGNTEALGGSRSNVSIREGVTEKQAQAKNKPKQEEKREEEEEEAPGKVTAGGMRLSATDIFARKGSKGLRITDNHGARMDALCNAGGRASIGSGGFGPALDAPAIANGGGGGSHSLADVNGMSSFGGGGGGGGSGSGGGGGSNSSRGTNGCGGEDAGVLGELEGDVFDDLMGIFGFDLDALEDEAPRFAQEEQEAAKDDGVGGQVRHMGIDHGLSAAAAVPAPPVPAPASAAAGAAVQGRGLAGIFEDAPAAAAAAHAPAPAPAPDAVGGPQSESDLRSNDEYHQEMGTAVVDATELIKRNRDDTSALLLQTHDAVLQKQADIELALRKVIATQQSSLERLRGNYRAVLKRLQVAQDRLVRTTDELGRFKKAASSASAAAAAVRASATVTAAAAAGRAGNTKAPYSSAPSAAVPPAASFAPAPSSSPTVAPGVIAGTGVGRGWGITASAVVTAPSSEAPSYHSVAAFPSPSSATAPGTGKEKGTGKGKAGTAGAGTTTVAPPWSTNAAAAPPSAAAAAGSTSACSSFTGSSTTATYRSVTAAAALGGGSTAAIGHRNEDAGARRDAMKKAAAAAPVRLGASSAQRNAAGDRSSATPSTARESINGGNGDDAARRAVLEECPKGTKEATGGPLAEAAAAPAAAAAATTPSSSVRTPSASPVAVGNSVSSNVAASFRAMRSAMRGALNVDVVLGRPSRRRPRAGLAQSPTRSAPTPAAFGATTGAGLAANAAAATGCQAEMRASTATAAPSTTGPSMATSSPSSSSVRNTLSEPAPGARQARRDPTERSSTAPAGTVAAAPTAATATSTRATKLSSRTTTAPGNAASAVDGLTATPAIAADAATEASGRQTRYNGARSAGRRSNTATSGGCSGSNANTRRVGRKRSIREEAAEEPARAKKRSKRQEKEKKDGKAPGKVTAGGMRLRWGAFPAAVGVEPAGSPSIAEITGKRENYTCPGEESVRPIVGGEAATMPSVSEIAGEYDTTKCPGLGVKYNNVDSLTPTADKRAAMIAAASSTARGASDDHHTDIGRHRDINGDGKQPPLLMPTAEMMTRRSSCGLLLQDRGYQQAAGSPFHAPVVGPSAPFCCFSPCSIFGGGVGEMDPLALGGGDHDGDASLSGLSLSSGLIALTPAAFADDVNGDDAKVDLDDHHDQQQKTNEGQRDPDFALPLMEIDVTRAQLLTLLEEEQKMMKIKMANVIDKTITRTKTEVRQSLGKLWDVISKLDDKYRLLRLERDHLARQLKMMHQRTGPAAAAAAAPVHERTGPAAVVASAARVHERTGPVAAAAAAPASLPSSPKPAAPSATSTPISSGLVNHTPGTLRHPPCTPVSFISSFGLGSNIRDDTLGDIDAVTLFNIGFDLSPWSKLSTEIITNTTANAAATTTDESRVEFATNTSAAAPYTEDTPPTDGGALEVTDAAPSSAVVGPTAIDVDASRAGVAAAPVDHEISSAARDTPATSAAAVSTIDLVSPTTITTGSAAATDEPTEASAVTSSTAAFDAPIVTAVPTKRGALKDAPADLTTTTTNITETNDDDNAPGGTACIVDRDPVSVAGSTAPAPAVSSTTAEPESPTTTAAVVAVAAATPVHSRNQSISTPQVVSHSAAIRDPPHNIAGTPLRTTRSSVMATKKTTSRRVSFTTAAAINNKYSPPAASHSAAIRHPPYTTAGVPLRTTRASVMTTKNTAPRRVSFTTTAAAAAAAATADRPATNNQSSPPVTAHSAAIQDPPYTAAGTPLRTTRASVMATKKAAPRRPPPVTTAASYVPPAASTTLSADNKVPPSPSAPSSLLQTKATTTPGVRERAATGTSAGGTPSSSSPGSHKRPPPMRFSGAGGAISSPPRVLPGEENARRRRSSLGAGGRGAMTRPLRSSPAHTVSAAMARRNSMTAAPAAAAAATTAAAITGAADDVGRESRSPLLGKIKIAESSKQASSAAAAAASLGRSPLGPVTLNGVGSAPGGRRAVSPFGAAQQKPDKGASAASSRATRESVGRGAVGSTTRQISRRGTDKENTGGTGTRSRSPSSLGPKGGGGRVQTTVRLAEAAETTAGAAAAAPAKTTSVRRSARIVRASKLATTDDTTAGKAADATRKPLRATAASRPGAPEKTIVAAGVQRRSARIAARARPALGNEAAASIATRKPKSAGRPQWRG